MKSTSRTTILIGLLLASGALVAWDRQQKAPAVSQAVARPQAAPSSATPAPVESTAIAVLKPREAYFGSGGDAFDAVRPQPLAVPPPVQPVVVEPPRPTAPPLPFTVIGKKLERGMWEIYLASGEQTFIASVGSVLADNYRVEEILPTTMKLTYLPLNEVQTLQTGAPIND